MAVSDVRVDGNLGRGGVPALPDEHPVPVSYDPSEQTDILAAFLGLLRGPIADGGRKRAAGEKVPWTEDPTHAAAMYRHLHRYEAAQGIAIDRDSGSHALVHVAARALMVAWQDMNG